MAPTVATGILLLVVPLVAFAMAAHPALYTVWSADRERHLAIVAAHRTAWRWLNAGFALATISSAAGLGALATILGADQVGAAASSGPDPARTAILAGVAVAYAVAGAVWWVVVAIRARTTPALADLVAGARETEPAETILGAALGGLFDATAIATPIILIVLDATLLASGGIAGPVAGAGLLIAAGSLGFHVWKGDSYPVVFYLPTQLIGLALLAGWS